MSKVDELKNIFQAQPQLELAILIGSQALGDATPQSDWDIAVRFEKHIQGWVRLQFMEALKQQIAEVLKTHRDTIDLIDMTSARLTMRAVIAEEGTVLKGEDSLAWAHYLTQTWAELEDYYWRLIHAA